MKQHWWKIPRHLLYCGFALSMLVPAFAHAQDTEDDPTTTPCTVDLSSLSALLTQAQSVAAQGEVSASLTYIERASDMVESIELRCNRLFSRPDVALERIYIAPNGTFSLEYPGTWGSNTFTPSASGGTVGLANSPEALAALSESMPILSAGQQGFLLTIGEPQNLPSGSQFTDAQAIAEYFGLALAENYETVHLSEVMDFGGLPAVWVEFGTAEFEGLLLVSQVNRDHFAIFAGASASGERASLQTVMEAIAYTIQFLG